MAYDVEFTDEFGEWYEQDLSFAEQRSVARIIVILEATGPSMKFPLSSGINGSRYSHMRELRVQHEGRPYRILYAFDPRRAAILLLGGDKTGDERWYDRMIPKADALYERHLRMISSEKE